MTKVPASTDYSVGTLVISPKDAKQKLKQNKVLQLNDEDFREIATFGEFKNAVWDAGVKLSESQEKILNNEDRFNSYRSYKIGVYTNYLAWKWIGYIFIFGLVCGFIYLLYEYDKKPSTA